MNNAAHTWSGKGGPSPIGKKATFAAYGGMYTGIVARKDFVNTKQVGFLNKLYMR